MILGSCKEEEPFKVESFSRLRILDNLVLYFADCTIFPESEGQCNCASVSVFMIKQTAFFLWEKK